MKILNHEKKDQIGRNDKESFLCFREIRARLAASRPKVHCLTNPVTMKDVANLLLTAGGSAIMAQSKKEAAEITSFCQATLLNTGVPDDEKWEACRIAGQTANTLGHPVVLDPVGISASRYRAEEMEKLLRYVKVSVIRCNQGEAAFLLHRKMESQGGVETSLKVGEAEQTELAERLANAYGCVSLISGPVDVVSDGSRSIVMRGGDSRAVRVTGSGCMLSALCALLTGAGISSFEAAVAASAIWKESCCKAGVRTDQINGGMGSFHTYLFDALDQICQGKDDGNQQDTKMELVSGQKQQKI
ncbi:MAG: hydroxyethylthiazole kinase [Clostridiales bacterium]|nr:hydroxyethylthiazole kinase [Clostridiales bacterium]